MNDFSNEIFTRWATAVREAHDGVKAVGEHVRQPSHFPTATLDEIENVTVGELEDSSNEERYSGLKYRMQIYSNKQSGKRAEARDIFITGDKAMRDMGFRRVTYTTTPEIYDSTMYSITATYEAIIDSNGVTYKR